MKTLKRRRQEFKTDYNKRIKLLKSQRPRIVFRRTNKYIIAQYVTSYEAQDNVDFGMLRTNHKGKVYAFLKGLIDAGLEISCKEEAFPESTRISGEGLKNDIEFKKIKSKIESIK